MKRILQISALAFMLMSSTMLRNTASAQSSVSISFQTFYDELSPYGRWIDYPEYGYVWSPDAGSDFRPYNTMGHWEWSDEYEWIWVSDYDWGWAPFHYGRWLYDPYYGWLWMPGYEWSPAWVAWRSGGDYYGWAPLRPGINIGINFSIGSYDPPVDYWCFAPRRYINSPRIYDYCVSSRLNVTIINNTFIINNYNYDRIGFRTGPSRYEAERYCGRINSVGFRESFRPGRSEFRNNEVSIYRPNVQRDDNRRFSPRSFDRFNQQQQNNNNGFRRDDNVNNSGNNLPQRQERNNQSPFDQRNNNGVRQDNNRNNNDFQNRGNRNVFDRNNNQQSNNGNNNDFQNRGNRNVFDRNNNQQSNNGNNNDFQNRGNRNVFDRNNNQPNRDDQRRVNPFERRDQSQPFNNNNNRGSNRREWQNQNNSNNQPQRQNQSQVERRQQQQQPRIFDRRDEGNQGSRSNDNNGRGNSRRRG